MRSSIILVMRVLVKVIYISTLVAWYMVEGEGAEKVSHEWDTCKRNLTVKYGSNLKRKSQANIFGWQSYQNS